MSNRTPTNHNLKTQSVALALDRLNNALQAATRPTRTHAAGTPPTLDLAAIPDMARTTLANVIRAGARRMVAEPWRVTRAVYPHLPARWPVAGRPLDEVRADCRALLEAERARAGHWSHDANRLTALRQADQALGDMAASSAGDATTDTCRRRLTKG